MYSHIVQGFQAAGRHVITPPGGVRLPAVGGVAAGLLAAADAGNQNGLQPPSSSPGRGPPCRGRVPLRASTDRHRGAPQVVRAAPNAQWAREPRMPRGPGLLDD